MMAQSGSGGGLPEIPEGFFPLYLEHDSYDEDKDMYSINPTDTTRELQRLVYETYIAVGNFDGWGYELIASDYGMEVYIDGERIDSFYGYDDGHIELFFDNIEWGGTLFADIGIHFWTSVM